jgi:glycerate-2-kinase
MELGFKPCVITAEQKGETGAVARQRAREVLSGKYGDCNAIILGGETTPVLPAKHGRGGRNQHYALASMFEMKDCSRGWVIASMGTDGSDYLPDVAGAIVDNSSSKNARIKGLDVNASLDAYDSNTLLKMLGGSLIITGETGTNTGDVILYLLKNVT